MLKKNNTKNHTISLNKNFWQSFFIHLVIILLIIVFGMLNKSFLPKTLQSTNSVQQKTQVMLPSQKIVKASLVDKKMVAQAVKRQENQQQLAAAKEKKLAQQKQEVDKLKKAAEQELQKVKEEGQKLKKHQETLKKEQQKVKATAEQLQSKEQELKTQKDKLVKQQQEQDKKKKIKTTKSTNNIAKTPEQASKIQQEVNNYHALWYNEIVNNRKGSMFFPEELACSIKIKLLANGHLSLVKLDKSSGNSVYDSFAEQAIYKSAPFAMPEDPEVNKELVALEYVFNFDDSSFGD
jgi:colicin import membrane protein